MRPSDSLARVGRRLWFPSPPPYRGAGAASARSLAARPAVPAPASVRRVGDGSPGLRSPGRRPQTGQGLSGKEVARIPVSTSSPEIPYGGFSPVRLQGWPFRWRLPFDGSGQACSRHTLPRRRFASTLRARVHSIDAPALRREAVVRRAPPFERHARSAPGVLARVRVVVSRSFIASRPHPPHSRAPQDFAAVRLIPRAVAVRERVDAPRVVPSFRGLFLLGMSSSKTPERSSAVKHPASPPTTSAFAHLRRARHARPPTIRFTWAQLSGLPVRICYDLSSGLPP